MATREEWTAAFWIQARSDWEDWHAVSTAPGVSRCGRLQILQMAAEKVGKSYLIDRGLRDPEVRRHVAFCEAVNDLLHGDNRDSFLPRGVSVRTRNRVRAGVINLAQQIERLSPAVDEENTPWNVEYPWISGEKLFVPAEFSFLTFESAYRDHWALLDKIVQHLFEALRPQTPAAGNAL